MSQVTLDASRRASRTFWAGLLIDVVLALAGTLALALADSNFAWTGAYWAALGTLLLKTALTSAASFVLRFWAPPKG
jgi:hypothetical protein